MANGKQEIKNRDVVKRRILLLLKYFYDRTDEDHQTNTLELLEYFKEQKTPANRKTLRNDIDTLMEVGYDIVVVPSKPNKYYMGAREFELAELKLLIDAVSSSRFISQKKSNQLIDKIAKIASKTQQEELKRNIYPTSRAKSTNESSFYVVDSINEAINQKKQISFKYFDYDVDKKKILRHDGERYELSPYALIWNEDFYYVMGYSEYYGKVVTFRVDRIRDVVVLDKKAKSKPRGFKVEEYAKKTFEMYDGEDAEVELVCDASVMKYIVDRFGEGVRTKSLSADRFKAYVDVVLSPTFYAWVFQFGGAIKIRNPKRAVEEMQTMAESVIY